MTTPKWKSQSSRVIFCLRGTEINSNRWYYWCFWRRTSSRRSVAMLSSWSGSRQWNGGIWKGHVKMHHLNSYYKGWNTRSRRESHNRLKSIFSRYSSNLSAINNEHSTHFVVSLKKLVQPGVSLTPLTLSVTEWTHYSSNGLHSLALFLWRSTLLWHTINWSRVDNHSRIKLSILVYSPVPDRFGMFMHLNIARARQYRGHISGTARNSNSCVPWRT